MAQIPRKHLRLPIKVRVFIEVMSACATGAQSAEIEICKTQDVSLSGMRVGLKNEAIVDAILHIGVDAINAEGASDTFYLAAEVRWCLPSEDPEYPWAAGFALLNASDSDIGKWVSLIHQLE